MTSRTSGTSPRRAHIAMIGNPVISHTLPGIEIIRELVARGHRVTYANDPFLADLVTSTGAELRPYRSTLPPVTGSTWPEDPVGGMTVFFDDAVQMLPQLHALYDDDPADLYLYDIGGYAGRALAESQGRPTLQISPTYVGWSGTGEDDIDAQIRALPGADAYFAKFADWLAGNGATTLEPGDFSGRPARAVATIPRAMQPHADKVDTEAVTFVGPCLGDRSDQGGWNRPAGARNVLLISLGSAFTQQPEFYRRCLAAFGDLPDWHVVLQVGKHTDPAELGSIPRNVEVHSWVPQLAILERADAFVTHAGMGGCNEGLYTGVPMIAVPQSADQFGNADQLVSLGVARRIDTADATPEALRGALLALTSDPEVARRSAALREEVRAEGGTARAADVAESLLS
ncbi:macrolide family glycosyltransferase [Streptomyces purpurogeneiscleroticus]|uniref:macrolide family glycosyltransferase n=1 Tax=Streptomyces purpurogeneiscleroticus TaxID=68259 RepID=UPI001CBD572A|nr:macrolide family glycosyltransferase [Streptomyces purpurogeneiscleroticus]MBZ4014443.1 glycosyl transferase [Streptomyces purpurogeneiscleroticus]